MDYKTHKEFFDKCGDQWLHPTQYGECFSACTVEEMYQHFKARMVEELLVTTPELLEPASLVDNRPNVMSTANLQGFADGVLHNLEHTSNKSTFYQRVRQVNWLLRPLKSPSNPAWRKFQFAYYSMPYDFNISPSAFVPGPPGCA